MAKYSKADLEQAAKAKSIDTTGLSDAQLFTAVTGLIYSEEAMEDKNSDWYVPKGAMLKKDEEDGQDEGGQEGGQGEGGQEGGQGEGGQEGGQEGGEGGSEIIVNPVEVTSAEALAEIENPEETPITVSNQEVVNAMTTNTVYKSIAISNAEVVDNDVKLNATDKITVDTLEVGGAKGSTNGKVIYSAPEVEFSNISLATGTTAYNVFEGTQDVNKPVSSVTLTDSTFDQPTLKHNVLNVYTPADNATILVKDCSFVLNPENSNVLRISNIANASGVTVTFENVDWSYEGYNGVDYSYAGLVMYQAYGADASFRGATTPTDDYIKTWNFVFKNCKYNGTKITENNYGAEAQVIYAYDVMTNGKTDATEYFNVSFE